MLQDDPDDIDPDAREQISMQLCAQALDLHQRGELSQAKTLYEQVLKRDPQHYDALHLLGVVFLQTGNFLQAEQLITRALAIHEQQAIVHYHHGLTRQALQQYESALGCFERAVALQHDYLDALVARAGIRRILGQHMAAIADYDQIIQFQPDSVSTWFNRGNACQIVGRYEDAVQSYAAALAIQPSHWQSWVNRGNALQSLARYQDAVSSYDQALVLNPMQAEACLNRGNALRQLGNPAEAISSYQRALSLQSDFVEAYKILAYVQRELKCYEEAIAGFEKVLQLEPSMAYLAGELLYTKMHVCRWDDFEAQKTVLENSVLLGEMPSSPFPLLCITDHAQVQLKAATNYAREKYPARMVPFPSVAGNVGAKLKIGYFSPDFRSHAVSFLIAGLLRQHDRQRFEIHAFSFIHKPDDPWQQRVNSAVDVFHDVSGCSEADIVDLARKLALDIAVDLTGYTHSNRTELFARRLAPVQISYLGFPGTMGASYIDYLIGDRTITPADHFDNYSEKIIVMPDSFQANDDQRIIGPCLGRKRWHLPENAFVYCSFNNPFKLTPLIFSAWMQILRATPGSVLWLLQETPEQSARLLKVAKSYAVNADRLIFAPRIEYEAHLARYQLVDLVLDTLPFSGGASTSDALWGGAPVLTCLGTTYAGRMSASLLRAVGLPGLVTQSMQDYINLGIELGQNPAQIAVYKAKLNLSDHNKLPLFSTLHFTRNLEQAYQTIAGRARRGEAPQHVWVASESNEHGDQWQPATL